MLTPRYAALDSQFSTGLTALGLHGEPGKHQQCLRYLELLARWNEAYNLTAITAPEDMVARHLLDSLSVAPYLHGRRLLDVGTGAGLPGVPLAIWHPEKEFHLLDSNGKKLRFLFQVKSALKLDNVSLHQCRAETLKIEPPFDSILSRAFSNLAEMLRVTEHLCASDGRFLAMKGRVDPGEMAAIPPSFRIDACIKLTVPGIGSERQLITIMRV